MYGYTAEEIVGCPISKLIPSDHPDELSHILQRLARGEHLDHYETTRVRKDGQRIDVSLTISPIRDAAGNISGASIIARDTTERNRVEDATRQSQQQLRALSAHLQTIREEERTRIAREIHDELGQVLTGLKMELSLLEESWSESTPHDARTLNERAFQRMRSLVDGSIQTVRKIATELRPMMLDNLGLSAAIEWQAEEFSKISGIPCEVSLPEDETVARSRHVDRPLSHSAGVIDEHRPPRQGKQSECSPVERESHYGATSARQWRWDSGRVDRGTRIIRAVEHEGTRTHAGRECRCDEWPWRGHQDRGSGAARSPRRRRGSTLRPSSYARTHRR